jgi:hypothetical protein
MQKCVKCGKWKMDVQIAALASALGGNDDPSCDESEDQAHQWALVKAGEQEREEQERVPF